MMCFRWPKLPCQLHIAMQIFPCSGPSEIQLPVTGFSSYILIITIDMELLLEVCERLYICWYLDLLFQSNSFRLLFSLCSSVFLFLGYLLGRYLHFPLPIIVTFLSRALWCMCYLLRFRFRFYFFCFLSGLLYTWDCDLVLRVTETKYVFQRCPFHFSLRSLFGSSILPFFS
jgi:hypothetical protein